MDYSTDYIIIHTNSIFYFIYGAPNWKSFGSVEEIYGEKKVNKWEQIFKISKWLSESFFVYM